MSPFAIASAFELYVHSFVVVFTHVEYTSSYSDIEVCEFVCIISNTTLSVADLVQVVSLLITL